MGLTFLSLISFAIISPVLLILTKRRRCQVLSVFLLFIISLAFYDLLYGPVLETHSFTALKQLPFIFSTHPYGRIAAFGFTVVGSLALLYGLEISIPLEQVVSVFALTSAVGITFADNFITFYIFWELLTLATTCLILLKGTPHSICMGYRYLFIQLSGGLLLFMGILQHYVTTGSWTLTQPAAGLAFFVIGIGIKTAFIPLHMWLPWGYPAASLSSSVMLSILTTKVGVYAVARVLPPNNFIAFMGAFMAVFGVCMAIMQTDLRKLLSYHIISQVGYMVAGVAIGLSLSVDGGLLHLVNHMIYKALLFMSVGALIYTTGTEDLHELQGKDEMGELPAWRLMPLAAVAAVAGSLSIVGVPPFNGYVSKYLLKSATAGINPVDFMLLLAGIGTTISFCKFAYFGFIRSRVRMRRLMPMSLQTTMAVTAFACLLLGIRPQLLEPLLPYSSSLAVYSFGAVFASLKPIVIGVITFMLIIKLLDPALEHRHLTPPAWLKSPDITGGMENVSSFYSKTLRIEGINNAQMIYIVSLTFFLIILFTFYRGFFIG